MACTLHLFKMKVHYYFFKKRSHVEHVTYIPFFRVVLKVPQKHGLKWNNLKNKLLYCWQVQLQWKVCVAQYIKVDYLVFGDSVVLIFYMFLNFYVFIHPGRVRFFTLFVSYVMALFLVHVQFRRFFTAAFFHSSGNETLNCWFIFYSKCHVSFHQRTKTV